MDYKKINIDLGVIWILLIGSILLIGLGYFANNQEWELSEIFKTSGFTLYFSIWLIILIDIIKSKLYNKTFWIMSMFILATIAPIVYLIQRSKLLKLNPRQA